MLSLTKEKALVFNVIIAIILLPLMAESIYAPGLPLLAKTFSVSEALAESTLSIYLLGCAFAVLFLGYASDFFGRKRILLFGLFLFLSASLGCYFSTSFWLFMVFRFFQAMGGAISSLSQSINRDVFSQKERIALSSTIGVIVSVAPGVGSIIGGMMMDQFALPWQTTFLLLMVFCVLLIVYIAFFFKETKQDAFLVLDFKSVFYASFKVLTDRQLWLYSVLIGLGIGVLYVFMSEGAFLFIERLEVRGHIFGWILGFTTSIYALGCLMCNRWIVQGYDRLNVMSMALFLVFMGYFSIMVAIAFQGVFADQFVLVLVFLAGVSAFGMGVFLTPCFALVLENHKENAGIAASWFGFTNNLINALVNFGMNHLHDRSLYTMPLYFCALAFMMAMFFFIAHHQNFFKRFVMVES